MKTIATNEWLGLDILKSLCVAAILFVHAHFLLITRGYRIYAPDSFVVQATEQMMIIGLLMTILPITAGCVMRMKLSQYMATNGRLTNRNGFMRNTLYTSLFIALAGFIMNALTWHIGYFFSWNMLQMVAAAYVLIALIFVRFSIVGLIIFIAALLLLAQPLANLLESYQQHYLVGIFVGNNYHFIFWPIFPWAAMPAIGFIITHYYLACSNNIRFQQLLLGAGLMLISVALWRDELVPELNTRYVWANLSTQPPLWEVLGAIGFFCLLLLICNYLANKIKISRYGMINSYSKGILWIYIMQMIISYRLAPWFKHHLDIKDRLEFSQISDILAYALFPVFMLALGWGFSALLIRFVSDKRYVIQFRKVS